jgi:hypothetical protein
MENIITTKNVTHVSNDDTVTSEMSTTNANGKSLSKISVADQETCLSWHNFFQVLIFFRSKKLQHLNFLFFRACFAKNCHFLVLSRFYRVPT